MKSLLLKILALVTVVASTFGIATACKTEDANNSNANTEVNVGTNNGEGEAHEHTYSDDWYYNATHHYKLATCHKTEKKDEAEHVIAENESECSVCHYNTNYSALEFKLNGNGSYALTDVSAYEQEKLVVPAYYNDKEVTSIAKGAFVGNTKTKEVVLPETVKTIEAWTFYDNATITKIDLAGVEVIEDYAFRNATAIKEISLPKVEKIGIGAFWWASSIEVINLPASVTEIGKNAFLGASSIKTITVNAENTKFKAVDDVLYSKDGKTLIQYAVGKGQYSFAIPNEVKVVEDSAFYGSSFLSSLTVGSAVTTIGEYAFNNCHKLVEVNNKSNLTVNKGSDAYGYLGKNAITVANKNDTFATKIQSAGNYISYTNGSEKVLLSYLGNDEELTIPNDFTQISSYAFFNNKSIKNITVPSTITNIGENAFLGCALENVTAPISVIESMDLTSLKKVTVTAGEKISKSAFANVATLEEITISSSIKTIGEDAFKGCSALKKVTYDGNIDGWAKITFENANANPISINGNIPQEDGTSIAGSELHIGGNEVTTATLTEKLGNYAFYNYKKLETITLQDTVSYVGGYSLEGTTFYTAETSWKEGVLYVNNWFITVKPEVTIVNIKDGTIGIAHGALANSEITELTIPSSVKHINSSAFSNAKKLTKVTYNAVNLTSYKAEANAFNKAGVESENGIELTIGADVQEIPTALFKGANLNEVRIDGTNLTKINENAFDGCSSITKVYYGKTENEWVEINFVKSSANPLKYAEEFYIGETLLTEAVIDTATIRAVAFYNYAKLEKLTIGDKVTSIGDSAFSGCVGLEEIIFKANVADFGANANVFAKAGANVKATEATDELPATLGGVKVTIGANVTKLPAYFANGANVTKVVFEENSTCATIGKFALANMAITEITIPTTVKTIEEEAFAGCESLEKVYYKGTVNDWVKIDFAKSSANPLKYAEEFYIGETLLTEAIITTEKVNKVAFYNYAKLEKVTLGKEVKVVGMSAFAGLVNLKEIKLEADLNDFIKTTDETTDAFTKAGANVEATEATDELPATLGGVTLVIGKDVTKLPAYMFYSATDANKANLKKVVFEADSKLATIGTWAFYGAGSISEVEFNNEIKSNSAETVEWNEINFVSGTSNPLYYAEKFVVKGIEITSVDVDAVNTKAFYGFKGLTRVVVKAGATIGAYAFYNCEGITEIFLEAGASEDLVKDINKDATVYTYSEAEPTTEGNFWRYVENVVTNWPPYVAPQA